jgi:hypothetical protein
LKRALPISLLVNVIAVTVIGYLALRTQTRTRYPIMAPVPATPAAIKAVDNPPAVVTVVTQRFEWRQLEAPDYPTYIANLRSIKCPERTVREIVAADLADLYAQKRQELHMDNFSNSTGPWSGQEQALVFARLFGDPSGSLPGPGNANESRSRDSRAATMPLAFQTNALATLKLDEEEWAAIRGLEDQFVREVGGIGQNPNDPDYLARWRKAQPELDARITDVIGRRALVQLDQALPTPADPDDQ